MALMQDSALAMLFAGFMGATQASFMAITNVYVLTVCPDRLRGRVSSLYVLHAGGIMAFANLGYGFLADLFNARVIFIITGLIFVVFLNPMYFLIMTLTHIINKKLTIILIISFITGPLFYFYLDNWGILISGFMSGTVGFYFFKGKKI